MYNPIMKNTMSITGFGTPRSLSLRLLSIVAVTLIDISFLIALDTVFVTQKRALILDSQEEFNELTKIIDPLKSELSSLSQRYLPDKDRYLAKAKEYLDKEAPKILAEDNPWYRIILTDSNHRIFVEYNKPDKIKTYNTWKNCFISRSFHAPVGSYQTLLTVYYTTPPKWPSIAALVKRYWIYAILFIAATWIGYWWIYRYLIMPLQRVGVAIEAMIHHQSVSLISSPSHDIEIAFNRLARNQREVLLSLEIDRIVDSLHNQPDDTAILDEYFRQISAPIQNIYPCETVEICRFVNGQYKPIEPNPPSATPKPSLAIDNVIPLQAGERIYGGIWYYSKSGRGFDTQEYPLIAHEIKKQAENGLARALTRSRALTEERNRFGINLATNMGHDLTNIIASGKWDLNTIERAHDLGIVSMDEKKGRFFLEAVEGLKNNLHFLQEMVNIYRSFGYIRRPRFETFDLSKLVHDITRLFKQSSSKKIEIILHCPPETRIFAEPRLLRMAIFNLLGNAAQALQKTNEERPTGIIEISIQPNENSHITIAVRDNGPGIRGMDGRLLTESEINRIFQSGYTTKETSSGGGLGLAWVKSIIEDFHHGIIKAQNNPDNGASFIVTIPYESTAKE